MGALSVLISFGLKLIFDRIGRAETYAAKAQSDLENYKLHVAEHFLSLRRFEGFEERLFLELKAIKDALAGKEDR